MKKKVLIAEDDQAIADVVKLILEGEGYQVEIAGLESIFLHKALVFLPDLILLDIWLDGVDGRRLAEALRKDKRTAKIPIIIVSANNEAKTIARQVGADDFLQKPFNLQDLIEKVSKHIS